MKKEKISVIIPTYNREKTIKKSVESVLNQTYKNIELIIVDDCSTDNTKEIIESINDHRIKYYCLEKNFGACYARNYGIEQATGEYIAFQDSDDIFRKNKLEEQLNNLKSNKSDFDFCKIKVHFDEITNIIPDKEVIKDIKNMSVKKRLCQYNFISTQAILAKREVLKNIKFDITLPRLQDYDLVLRISSKYKISYTDKILVDLFVQDDSISKSPEKLKKACLIMISKNYDLDLLDYEVLKKTLIYFYSGDIINEKIVLQNEYEKLAKDYKKLEQLFYEINDKYKNSETKLQRLDNDYLILKNEYEKTINSKRYRFITKLIKIIKRQ